jgi:hypothetical protein
MKKKRKKRRITGKKIMKGALLGWKIYKAVKR